MKKKSLIMMLCATLLLSSCNIFTYKEYWELDSESLDYLEQKKTEFMVQIDSKYKDSDYFEDNLHQLRLLKQECRNILNECDNIPALEGAFERCEEAMRSLKNKVQYLESKLSQDMIDKIKKDYYEAEKKVIQDKYVADLVTKIDEFVVTKDMDDKIKEFLDYIEKNVKTKQDHIEEMWQALEEARGNCYDSEYYNFQVEAMNKIVSNYEGYIQDAATFGEANRLLSEAQQLLSSLKTKEEIIASDKLAAINECYEALLNLKDTSEYTPEEIEEYHLWCLQLKNQMEGLDNAHEVMLLYLNTALDYLETLEYDPEQKLADIKALKIKVLQYEFIGTYAYREEDETALRNLFEGCQTIINSATDLSDLSTKYSSSYDIMSQVKTNEELTTLERAQFLSDIHDLCGEQTLTLSVDQMNINSYREFADLIDYYIFYQKENSDEFVQDEIRVKVNFPYKSAYSLRNTVYWYCSMIRSVADMTFEKEEDYIVVKLRGYDQAIAKTDQPHYSRRGDLTSFDNGGTPTSSRDPSFDDFAYLSRANKVLCWSSQQVVYALMNGYCPVAKEGSKAELIINRGKDILRSIVKDGMDEYEKLFQIYQWLGENVSFDNDIYKYNTSSDMDNYVGENVAKYTSLYAEGALFDGQALCSGYAKAFTMLMNMEGITTKKVTSKVKSKADVDTINTGTESGYGYTFGHHEIAHVYLDDVWFFVDPEKAASESRQDLKSNVHLLLPISYETYGPSTAEEETDPNIDYTDYMFKKLKVNGNSVFVSNKEELTTLMSSITSLPSNQQFSIIYTTDYPTCKADFISLKTGYEFFEYYTTTNVKELIIYTE